MSAGRAQAVAMSQDDGNVIRSLVSPYTIPKVVPVIREFPRPRIDEIERTVRERLEESGVLRRIRRGTAVAVAVGSRGITDEDRIVAALVERLQAAGAAPFIVPAMGSHGGATAEGQQTVLADLGITEKSVGVPIRSSMDVEQVGESPSGVPVYCDAQAASADAIVVVNRIKPHTTFRGSYESGLMKMLAIGLGKQRGAETCHALGFREMASRVPEVGAEVIRRLPVAFGLGIVENAYHETAELVPVPAERMVEVEPRLLEKAWRLYPSIGVQKIDVLVIDEIGKDISGTGFDTNIVGRYSVPETFGGPEVTRVVVLSLTSASHGNANGLGLADYTTRRTFEMMSFEATYPNALTSTVPASVKVPMVLPGALEAVQAAIRTANLPDPRDVRLVRIRNTLCLDRFEISENLLPEVEHLDGFRVIGEPHEIAFSE